jgi:hypothetical protein
LIFESTKNRMTTMIVDRVASDAPITCSRLLWRTAAAKSRMAARGPTGLGNQDIAAR